MCKIGAYQIDPKLMEESLELDGRLVIDAEVLPHELLHMVGHCTTSYASYHGGIPDCEKKTGTVGTEAAQQR